MSVISKGNAKSMKIDYSDPQSRSIALQFELKMLLIYGPQLGLYVLSHLNQPNIWQGIIFVRHGYYKQGTFRFRIHLEDFPQSRPRIFFKTAMYHPLVDCKTGELDVNSTLVEPWNYYSESLLYNLINEFTLIFTDQQKLSNKNSFNSQAATLLEQDSYAFLTKANECVQISNDSVGEQQQGSPLNMSQIQQQQKVNLAQRLLEAKELPIKLQDKVQYFVKSIML